MLRSIGDTGNPWNQSRRRQEAQLSPSDPAMRLVSSNSCQLPRNSAETTYMTSPDQTDGMKLEV